MQNFVILACLVLSSLLPILYPFEQSPPIRLQGANVTYQYGEQAVITVNIQSSESISEVYLLYQDPGSDTLMQKMALPDSLGISRTVLDLHSIRLRPFAPVTYWFKVTPVQGEMFTSNPYQFYYLDNRLKWKSLEVSGFIINWVSGDFEFGQAVVNETQKGLKAIQELLPDAGPVKPVVIYVYPSSQDLQNALELNGLAWVAGHSSPDLGIILVSIPVGSEQGLEMERQIPHELTHVLLYQVTGSGYKNLPVWLSEGLASLAELYPNADYPRSLEQAKKNQAILPMAGLCQSFPQDASSAFLAYAQSASFVNFIRQTYGSSGLYNLVMQYKDGKGCSEGVAATFNLPLDRLDYNWRQQILKVNLDRLAFQNILPYLLLIAVILIGLILPVFLVRRKSGQTTPT